MVKVGIVVNALFLLVLGGFVSVSSAQPPPVKKEIAQQRAELSAEVSDAIKDIVTTDADRHKVAQLRDLLKRRHRLIKTGSSAEGINNVDCEILNLTATIDEPDRARIMEALERIWDAEEDYYETLEDILDHLDDYSPTLVTGYALLPPWKVFIKDWKPKLVVIRGKLPPYPWRAKKPFVKPPQFRPLKPAAPGPKPGIKSPQPPPKPPAARPAAPKSPPGKPASPPPKPHAGKPKPPPKPH
jgi:hypothetical protein